MERTLFAIALVVILISAAAAEIMAPWRFVFRDTVVTTLEQNRPGILNTSTKVYKNSREISNALDWVYYPVSGLWIRPQFHSDDEVDSYERVRDIEGKLIIGRRISNWLDGEIYANPQRSIVQVYGDRLEKKFRHNMDGGGRILFSPVRSAKLSVGGGLIYSYDRDWDGDINRNPGWETEISGKAGFFVPAIDTVKITGNLNMQKQDKSNRAFSFLHIINRRFIDSRGNAFMAAFKQSNGKEHDEYLELDEKAFSRSVCLRGIKRIGQSMKIDVYGAKNWQQNVTLQNVKTNNYQVSALGKLEKNNTAYNGLIGFTKAWEHDSEDSTMSNVQQHLLMEADITFCPRYDLKLEWRGHGKKIAKDYEKDTTSNNRDNDNISLDHWLKASYYFSPACSLFGEIRYSENVMQYLRSAHSYANRIQEIYSFSPSVFWNIGKVFSHRQYFEILANYAKNPFSPSNNWLFRQIKSTSNFAIKLSPRNKIAFSLNYRKSDVGNIDTLNYYSISNKTYRHDWLLELERKMFKSIILKPGFGKTKDYTSEFISSTGFYEPVSDRNVRSRLYSLKILISGKYYPFIATNICFIDESDGNYYWDAKVIAQMKL